MGSFSLEDKQKLDRLAAQVPLKGEGSPEGFVPAIKGRLYIDYLAGLLYVKVDGTGNTGWIPA